MLGWFAVFLVFLGPLLPVVLARHWLRRQGEVVKVTAAFGATLACLATLPLIWGWMALCERHALDGYAASLGARLIGSEPAGVDYDRRDPRKLLQLAHGPRHDVDLLWPDGRRSVHRVVVGGRWLGWLSWRAEPE